MKTYTLAGLLASPLTALAAPAWIMYAYNESFPEIHGAPINADSGAFWVHRDAAAVCPDYDPDCPAKNTTIVSGPVYGSGTLSESQYWFMGILQEGGQSMNTAGLDSTTGGLALKYVAVDAEKYGVGVYDVARSAHPGLVLDNSTVSTLGAPTIRTETYYGTAYTWMACPRSNLTPDPASLDEVDLSRELQIRTITTDNVDAYPSCVRLEIVLKLTTLAAPQYYFCKGCQWRCDAIYGQSQCDFNMKPACLEPYCGPYTEETKADKV